VKKYGTARQATDDNTAHAYCMLGTSGYKHTLRIRNICCFAKEKTVTRKRFNIMSYLYDKSFSYLWKLMKNLTLWPT